MEEQELKYIWRRSSEKEEIMIKTKALITDFKHKMERRERIVRRRDLKETLAWVVVVLIYGYMLVTRPFTVSSIGSCLFILTATYVVLKLYNIRKSKFAQNLFLPIKEQLLQQRAFMLAQAKLLRNVHLLFLPVLISYMVLEWGDYIFEVNHSSFSEFIVKKKTIVKLVATMIVFIIGVVVSLKNKKAAKVNWDPLISDINVILENLDKEKK